MYLTIKKRWFDAINTGISPSNSKGNWTWISLQSDSWMDENPLIYCMDGIFEGLSRSQGLCHSCRMDNTLTEFLLWDFIAWMCFWTEDSWCHSNFLFIFFGIRVRYRKTFINTISSISPMLKILHGTWQSFHLTAGNWKIRQSSWFVGNFTISLVCKWFVSGFIIECADVFEFGSDSYHIGLRTDTHIDIL